MHLNVTVKGVSCSTSRLIKNDFHDPITKAASKELIQEAAETPPSIRELTDEEASESKVINTPEGRHTLQNIAVQIPVRDREPVRTP